MRKGQTVSRLISLSQQFVWVFCVAILGACSTPLIPLSEPPAVSVLRVVMDDNYPPYVFRDDQGNLQGILIDQWKLWEERTGVKVEITALPWGEALDAMKASQYDVIDTIFYTQERAAIFDFTEPYAQIDVRIFFQNNISGIADAEDLRGFRVAVKSGDANAEYLLERGVTDLEYYNSYEEIIQAAAAKQETIFVIDQPPALYFLYKSGIQDSFNYSAPLYSGEFHRAVKKGNTAILNLVSDGFARIRPAEIQAINDRWFGVGQNDRFQKWIPWLGMIGAGAILVIAILFVFNRTLQRRVQIRTRELEDALLHLRKSESQFQLAMDATSDGLWDWDLVTGEVYYSPGYLRMLGYAPGEFSPTYEAWRSRVHPDDIAETERALAEHQAGRTEQYGVEFRFKTKSGTWRWILARGKVVQRDTHGNVTRMVGTHTDITERKQVEDELRTSEHRFRVLFEQAGVGVAQIDTQTGQFIHANQKYCDIVGYTRTEIEQLDFKTITHPDDLQRDLDHMEHLKAGEISEFVMEKRYFRKDGSIVWVILVVSPLWQPGETPNFHIAAVHDITEQKKMELALRDSEAQVRKLNAELERRVEERTTQLQATNKELEAFAYSVSHDLRAPLRAIDGFSRILLEDYASQLDADAQGLLQRIVAANQSMGQLVDALLWLSRMTRAEMQRVEVNLSHLANTIIHSLHQASLERDAEFIIARDIVAMGDPHLLRVIMENLLGNAWKFTSKCEHTRIEFGVTQQKSEIVYFVRDNGAGFDMAYANKLFKAFQRLHTVNQFEGTGIGLATVQRIISRHGGRVWAEAEEGKGATFYFTLKG
jgi:PAS domain S-box-containing protein